MESNTLSQLSGCKSWRSKIVTTWISSRSSSILWCAVFDLKQSAKSPSIKLMLTASMLITLRCGLASIHAWSWRNKDVCSTLTFASKWSVQTLSSSTWRKSDRTLSVATRTVMMLFSRHSPVRLLSLNTIKRHTRSTVLTLLKVLRHVSTNKALRQATVSTTRLDTMRASISQINLCW
jgi:hypothetical protein